VTETQKIIDGLLEVHKEVSRSGAAWFNKSLMIRCAAAPLREKS
jgi:hypothetical protein